MKTKKWVKKIINAKKKIIGNRVNGKLELCGERQKELLIYKGIAKIAEDLGFSLNFAERLCEQYPQEAYFEYDGFKILQLLSKEEVEKNEIK